MSLKVKICSACVNHQPYFRHLTKNQKLRIKTNYEGTAIAKMLTFFGLIPAAHYCRLFLVPNCTISLISINIF